MRLASSLALLASALTAAFVSGAMVTVPPLFSCEPASIHVKSVGNYTIEGRDQLSHRLYFRAHVKQNTTLVTWDAVDMPPNSTAVVTVTDQIAPSPSATIVAMASAVVQVNPMGNSTCLHQADRADGGSRSGAKNMVPTIVGIVLGAFFLLVLLLVGGMMYRRKKEKGMKVESDSVDLHQGGGGHVPAGGSYMARLVPGLKLGEARPLPRDPVLEEQQKNYASTRRGTQYYQQGPDGNGFELRQGPNQQQPGGFQQQGSPYGGPQRFQGPPGPPPQQWQQYNGPPGGPHSPQGQMMMMGPGLGYGPPPPQGPGPYGQNPFGSQTSLHHYQPQLPRQGGQPQQVYGQKDWGNSQTSFLSKLSKKSSK